MGRSLENLKTSTKKLEICKPKQNGESVGELVDVTQYEMLVDGTQYVTEYESMTEI